MNQSNHCQDPPPSNAAQAATDSRRESILGNVLPKSPEKAKAPKRLTVLLPEPTNCFEESKPNCSHVLLEPSLTFGISRFFDRHLFWLLSYRPQSLALILCRSRLFLFRTKTQKPKPQAPGLLDQKHAHATAKEQELHLGRGEILRLINRRPLPLSVPAWVWKMGGSYNVEKNNMGQKSGEITTPKKMDRLLTWGTPQSWGFASRRASLS